MYVLAGGGTFLSFFHPGSLGGLYGVMQARPFAFRMGFLIWPSTFFLFTASAMAAGPSFLVLTTSLMEKITGMRLVENSVLPMLGKISGIIAALRVVDSVRVNRVVRACPGDDSSESRQARKHALANPGRRAGVPWGRAQPLRSDDSNARSPLVAIRFLPFLLAELAGGRSRSESSSAPAKCRTAASAAFHP